MERMTRTTDNEERTRLAAEFRVMRDELNFLTSKPPRRK